MYADHCLYVYGGWDGQLAYNSLHKLDVITMTWTELKPSENSEIPMKMSGCGLVRYGKSKLVLFGGCGVPTEDSQQSGKSGGSAGIVSYTTMKSSEERGPGPGGSQLTQAEVHSQPESLSCSKPELPTVSQLNSQAGSQSGSQAVSQPESQTESQAVFQAVSQSQEAVEVKTQSQLLENGEVQAKSQSQEEEEGMTRPPPQENGEVKSQPQEDGSIKIQPQDETQSHSQKNGVSNTHSQEEAGVTMLPLAQQNGEIKSQPPTAEPKAHTQDEIHPQPQPKEEGSEDDSDDESDMMDRRWTNELKVFDIQEGLLGFII